VAHLSDPHLLLPEMPRLQDLLGKRLLGYLSWRLRRCAAHRGDVEPALRSVLTEAPVDHIVVTGDATHLGLPGDFRAALEFLQTLGSPDRVTLIPGNHDAYVAAAWGHGLQRLQPYLESDHAGRAVFSETGMTPSMRIRGNIAIIGVSSARPTSLFFASGTAGREQLQRLGSALRAASKMGLFRLVLIHHPPVAGLTGWRRRLTDLGAFASVVRQQGSELILHGHTHRFSEAVLDGPNGSIAVFGVPSITALSASHRRAGFRRFRIGSRPSHWSVEVESFRYSTARTAFERIDNRLLSIKRRPV
jgi:3',5'-cyclic AMP phosphodiesterase CpdA